MVSIGYHYTKKATWEEFLQAQPKMPALCPMRRLVRVRSITDLTIPDLPDWAHDIYIFAFPEQPAPKPWKDYHHWKPEWQMLTKEIGSHIIELKFSILQEDEAFVVERAHFAEFQWGHRKNKAEALRRYAFSRVPASQYSGNYIMPELIIRNEIELKRLEITGEIRRVQ